MAKAIQLRDSASVFASKNAKRGLPKNGDGAPDRLQLHTPHDLGDLVCQFFTSICPLPPTIVKRADPSAARSPRRMRQGVPAADRHSSEMPQSGCHGGNVPKSIIGGSRENVMDGIEASRQRLNVLAR